MTAAVDPTDLSVPFNPADYLHQPDPAHTASRSLSGAPGEDASLWPVCVHCRQRYPAEQAGECHTRSWPVRQARQRALLGAA